MGSNIFLRTHSVETKLTDITCEPKNWIIRLFGLNWREGRMVLNYHYCTQLAALRLKRISDLCLNVSSKSSLHKSFLGFQVNAHWLTSLVVCLNLSARKTDGRFEKNVNIRCSLSTLRLNILAVRIYGVRKIEL